MVTTQATVRDRAGNAKQVDARIIQQTVGKRGLSIWGGFLHEEYLPQLGNWHKQAKLFIEMRDDPTVGALLNAIKLPLLAAEIGVKAASEQSPDQEAARFLERNLNEMDRQSWRSYTEDALECLDFGFAIGEVIMEKRRDGHLWLRNIEPRGQETVRRWLYRSEESEELVGFEQAPFRGADLTRTIEVPLDKCVHIVYRGRKGNPQGRALLRSLYTPYVFVKNLRTFEGIKIERDVGGTPVLKMRGGIADITGSEFNELRDQLDGLKLDETLWITLPEGFELEPYATATNTAYIRDTIRDHQKDMLKVFFAQFLELGMDSAGTQALVKGSQDFFSLALESVQQIVLESWNQQLVPLLFQFNRFPGMTKYPEISWAPPGKNDLTQLMQLYSEGTTAKVLTATREDEVWVRDVMDLPELPDGEGMQDRSQPEPTPFPGFPGMGPQPNGQPQNGAQPNSRQPQMSAYVEAPDLRPGYGIYERFTNDYQRDLVGEYDDWARETSRLLSLNEKTPAQITDTIVGRLDQLSADLKMLGRRRISEAAGLGMGDVLGKHAQKAEVQQVISNLIDANDRYIDESLIPSVRERALASVPDTLPLTAKQRQDSFLSALTTRRARVAQTAGGAVTAIFEPQRVAGRIENNERRSRGESLIKVRWVLDDRAEHCADDGKRGTFGCPNLARVYDDGWDRLPTVPAANVSCLGNCRCQLYADFNDGNGWVRIT